MHLKRALKEAGYPGDPGVFRDTVVELFQTLYPAWTDEVLLHNPVEAHRFCDALRHRCRFVCPDELILRTLTNTRKRTHGQQLPA
jgi:hypothetical protein